MSAIVETFIICDKCGDNWGVDSRDMTAAFHRKHAKAEGWTHKAGKDYCEECSPKKASPHHGQAE